MILSKSMTGAIWKSKTKYWNKKNRKEVMLFPKSILSNKAHKYVNRNRAEKGKKRKQQQTYLIVIWAIGAFFYRGVLSVFFIAYLHTNHWIHIESCQLSCLNHTNADLEVLGFEARSQGITGRLWPVIKIQKATQQGQTIEVGE